MYRKAEELPLALANLSQAYLGRGFLSEATELAQKASKSSDTQTQSRAANALQRIEDMRRNEDQRKEKIIADSAPEREFRAKFARMFLSPETAKLSGRFKTPFGELSFEQNGPVVTGTAQVEEELPKSSFASLMVGPADLTKRIKTLHFEAVLQGRTGQFTFEVRGIPISSLLTSELSKAKGLIIVDQDASSIEILDESRHPCVVSVAQRVEAPSAAAPSEEGP